MSPKKSRNRYFTEEEAEYFKELALVYFVCNNCDQWFALNPVMAPKRCGYCLRDNRWLYVPEMTGTLHSDYLKYCKTEGLVTNLNNFKRYFRTEMAEEHREKWDKKVEKNQELRRRSDEKKLAENPALKHGDQFDHPMTFLDIDSGFLPPPGSAKGSKKLKTFNVMCYKCGKDFKKRTSEAEILSLEPQELICRWCKMKERKGKK